MEYEISSNVSKQVKRFSELPEENLSENVKIWKVLSNIDD